MMHDWGYGWGWGGGMFFGPLFMVAGPLLLVVLIVILVRWLTNNRESASGRIRTPREILDERFARGDLQRAVYE